MDFFYLYKNDKKFKVKNIRLCKKCNLSKNISEFWVNKNGSGGHNTVCKDCIKQYESYEIGKKKFVEKRREKNIIIKNELKKEKLDFYLMNKEIIDQQDIAESIIKKEKRKEYYKKYYKNVDKEKINNRIKNKRKKDPLFKLSGNIRNLIMISIRKMGYSKNSKTKKILGCSYEEFKIHLESQFKEGMSWENYGKWHLDHKIPISWAKNEDEIYELNKFTNFQPLWAEENIKKSNIFFN